MTTFKNFVMAAVLAFATILPAATSSQAMPFPIASQNVERESDVTSARIVCGYYGCRRVWRPYYGPRVYVAPPVVIVRPGYRRGYGAHRNWCLSRYRSYNPSNNLYIAYGNVYKTCRSPYRY